MTMTVALLVLTGVVLVAYLMRRRARLDWLRGTTTSRSQMANLGLKSTALAAGSVSLGAAIFGTTSMRVHVVLLSLGLLALAASALQETDSRHL